MDLAGRRRACGLRNSSVSQYLGLITLSGVFSARQCSTRVFTVAEAEIVCRFNASFEARSAPSPYPTTSDTAGAQAGRRRAPPTTHNSSRESRLSQMQVATHRV